MQRSGVADLPLHGGRVPHWLAERMTKLGTAVAESIILDYGTTAFLSRGTTPGQAWNGADVNLKASVF